MMGDSIEFSLIGVDETVKTMKAIPAAIRAKGARFAMRKAANIVRDAARRGALQVDDPRTARVIAENIVVRNSTRYFKQTRDIKLRIGVMGGAKVPKPLPDDVENKKQSPGGYTFHWRFKEFGTAKTPAEPFMRPALEQNIDKCTAEYVTQLDKWLGRNIPRLRKQGKL